MQLFDEKILVIVTKFFVDALICCQILFIRWCETGDISICRFPELFCMQFCSHDRYFGRRSFSFFSFFLSRSNSCNEVIVRNNEDTLFILRIVFITLHFNFFLVLRRLLSSSVRVHVRGCTAQGPPFKTWIYILVCDISDSPTAEVDVYIYLSL